MRQTSQSSTWLPEGEGELVFQQDNLPPSGPPPVLPITPDAVWHRTEVQANVRRWLPYLGLSPRDLAAAEQEWEQVFSAMPPGGGAPAASVLQWMELPKAAITGGGSARTVAAAADMVENPAVNPIHSRSGRTYNMVRTELLAHHQRARAEAAAGGETPPVFLSEYVFFETKADGRDIALGIVSKAPPGGSVSMEDVLDVTEYVHTAISGYSGFFGTFSAKENPSWDKNVPGSLKYVKHRDLPRRRIKVFNVRVWKDTDGALRAHIHSLRALATAAPACSLSRIPDPYLRAPEHHHGEADTRRGATGGEASGVREGDAREGRDGACEGRGGAAGDDRPAVKPKTRVSVYWTEAPIGWYTGIVTSSRRAENGRWESRVAYDDKHVAWHFLDGEDSVKWRECDSSDEEETEE